MILTLASVASSVFGVDGEGDLTDDQIRWSNVAIDKTHSLLFSYLRRNTDYGTFREVLASGEKQFFAAILPQDIPEQGSDRIVVSSVPIQVSTVVVKVSDETQVFDDAPTLTRGVDYFVEEAINGWSKTGVLRRVGKRWPMAPGGVQVDYVGGVDVTRAPEHWDAIVQAADIVFANEFAKAKAFGKFAAKANTELMASESIGKYSRSIDHSVLKSSMGNDDSYALPNAAIQLLMPLVRVSTFI